MKKTLVRILTIVMALSLAACGNSAGTSTASSTGSVESTAAESTGAESSDAGSETAVPAESSWVKNVEIQVPAAAGGGTDVMARTIGQYISQESDSNLTIVNNTDGSGVVAFETVRNAKPDGSTLLHFHSTMLIKIATGVYDKDVVDDFQVIFVAKDGDKANYVLLVSADYDAQTLDEVIEKAKANPGELLVGVETGGSSHVMAGLFAQAAGIDVKFVEAGADTEKLTALVGGSIDMCLVNPNQAKQYVEAERATALAVVSRDEEGARGSVLPDVPSFMEQGVDFSYGTLHLILGPKDMDESLAREINARYVEAVAAEEVMDVLVPAGFAMDPVPFDEGVETIQKMQDKLNGVVAELGLDQ